MMKSIAADLNCRRNTNYVRNICIDNNKIRIDWGAFCEKKRPKLPTSLLPRVLFICFSWWTGAFDLATEKVARHWFFRPAAKQFRGCYQGKDYCFKQQSFPGSNVQGVECTIYYPTETWLHNNQISEALLPRSLHNLFYNGLAAVSYGQSWHTPPFSNTSFTRDKGTSSPLLCRLSYCSIH